MHWNVKHLIRIDFHNLLPFLAYYFSLFCWVPLNVPLSSRPLPCLWFLYLSLCFASCQLLVNRLPAENIYYYWKFQFSSITFESMQYNKSSKLFQWNTSVCMKLLSPRKNHENIEIDTPFGKICWYSRTTFRG